MKAANFSESVVEQAALAWLESLGYAVLYGPEIAAGEPGAERGAAPLEIANEHAPEFLVLLPSTAGIRIERTEQLGERCRRER